MTPLRKFFYMSPKEQKLFIEAVFFLFFSKVFLFLPFSHCIKIIKPGGHMSGAVDLEVLHDIRCAVTRANRLAFWANICLVKSLAARMMLQRRNIGSTLYLGLLKNQEKDLVAHAWLMAGGVCITPKGDPGYQIMYRV